MVILFIYKQNTNIAKRLAEHPFDGPKLMVEPPKEQGRQEGFQACPTPHRPNPIGLSLCGVVRVEKGALVVAGVDCLDGTPVIDIKPYLYLSWTACPTRRHPVGFIRDSTRTAWLQSGEVATGGYPRHQVQTRSQRSRHSE